MNKSKDGHSDNIEELFGWTIQTKQLLRQITERFASTTQAWDRFIAPNGDESYLSDIHDPASLIALNRLKVSFQELDDLQRKLVLLDKSCEESKEIVSSPLKLSMTTF